MRFVSHRRMKRRLKFCHLPHDGDEKNNYRQAQAERRHRYERRVELRMLNDKLSLYRRFCENFLTRFLHDVCPCPSNEHEEDNRTKHKRDDVRRKADCSGSPQYLKRKHILLSFCERTIDLPHWQVIKTHYNIILQIHPSVNNYRTHP